MSHTGLGNLLYCTIVVQGLKDIHLNQAPPSRVILEQALWCQIDKSTLYSWTHLRWGPSPVKGVMMVDRIQITSYTSLRVHWCSKKRCDSYKVILHKILKRLVTNIQHSTQGSNMFRTVKAFSVRQSWGKKKWHKVNSSKKIQQGSNPWRSEALIPQLAHFAQKRQVPSASNSKLPFLVDPWQAWPPDHTLHLK